MDAPITVEQLLGDLDGILDRILETGIAQPVVHDGRIVLIVRESDPPR